MYEFPPLELSSLQNCQSFIPENILSQITIDQDPDHIVIAFGATTQNHLVGSAIALLNRHLHYLEFLHIEVDPDHRNQHIGRTLIAKIQEKAKKNGAKIFSLIYPKNTPETPAIEKILTANQWKGSRPFMIKCYFNGLTFDAPWIHLDSRYPEGYQEFRWKYLKEKEREDLQIRQQQGHFQSLLSPFREENHIDYLNSLGLRHEGKVVGWLITHRIAPETISYSSLYITPSLQFRGIAIKLLTDSILLHMKARVKWAYLEIPLLQVHPSWVQFIKKRLIPYASTISYLQQGWQTIP